MLNFQSTKHNKCIYQTTFKGHTVLLLYQVDNFLISCKLESVAKRIFHYIGNKLQLHNKKVPPFKYLGPAKDYNDINLIQTRHYIGINCAGYIDCVNCAHRWDKPDLDKIKSKPTSPLPEKCLS